MSLKINHAAVLGSGVMGAQIAAHLAAAGIRTYLFDLPSEEGPKDKKLAAIVGKNVCNTIAITAIENLKRLKPSPLVSETILARLIPCNFDDHMPLLADVDWVVEAVVERLDIKQGLHAKVAKHVGDHATITTNTSGISLKAITEGLPDSYRSRFFGTHFFNPPRYMKLLEIVTHDDVDCARVKALATWIENRLGKGIVYARDTINFIANRVGVFTIQATMKHMVDLGLNIETVDALTGKLMGRPASATYRTMDVVGLDTYAHVTRNVHENVPDDPYRAEFLPPAWLAGLIEAGAHGQKSGGTGCYKKAQDEKGNRVILAFRPESGEYAAQEPKAFPWQKDLSREPDTIRRLSVLLDHDDEGAQLVWRVLRDTFSYSALLLEEIAGGEPNSIDNAIKWGFNWELGPFELWEGLGFDKILEKMKADGSPLPAWAKPGVSFYEPASGSATFKLTGAAKQHDPIQNRWADLKGPEGQIRLPTRPDHDDPRTVFTSKGATLLDIGDGVACFVFHSKMNAIDDDILQASIRVVETVSRDFDALVLGNDGAHFSAGANLKLIGGLIQQKDWQALDKVIRDFQAAVMGFKYAPFPTVSCPQGMVLGGGCEFAMHAAHRVVLSETYAGLVETGVGLLPAGGGTKELALRAYSMTETADNGDPLPFLTRAFMLIGLARTSTSGLEAIEMGLLPRSSSTLVMSRDQQIFRAKARARLMADEGYAAPIPPEAIAVVGDPAVQSFRMMLYNMLEGRQLSQHDAFIAERIARVLCGGEVDPGSIVSEQYFLDLERRAFVELCQQEKTLARIQHMLENGKPLRN